MSQSGPAVAKDARWSTPGQKWGGGAGESPDANTTCGGRDGTGWDGTTGRSSRTAAVLFGRTLYQRQSRKRGNQDGGSGGGGPTSDVLLHVGAGRRGRT